MAKIEFTRDYEVKDGTGTKYRKGQVVEMSDDSALHFKNRQAAIDAKPKRGPKPKAHLNE